MPATVIAREEVLHVARLARLALREDELEPMARELSAVLDHIAKIGELDLEDVPPTSHVVEVTGGLRPDEPRPSLPREVALAQAPAVSGEGFLVPSPQAGARRTSSTCRPPRRPRRSAPARCRLASCSRSIARGPHPTGRPARTA
jgi:aspartyl-tRNA(Asn)/glutamyl-tRNA(Gln) amidotransferase subunit C